MNHSDTVPAMTTAPDSPVIAAITPHLAPGGYSSSTPRAAARARVGLRVLFIVLVSVPLVAGCGKRANTAAEPTADTAATTEETSAHAPTPVDTPESSTGAARTWSEAELLARVKEAMAAADAAIERAYAAHFAQSDDDRASVGTCGGRAVFGVARRSDIEPALAAYFAAPALQCMLDAAFTCEVEGWLAYDHVAANDSERVVPYRGSSATVLSQRDGEIVFDVVEASEESLENGDLGAHTLEHAPGARRTTRYTLRRVGEGQWRITQRVARGKGWPCP